MNNKIYKTLFAIFLAFSFYGCSTLNEGLEETDKTLKSVESKGTDVVNSMFGETQTSTSSKPSPSSR